MRPNFSKPIQAFPNFSKEIPSFSKLFPRKFQTFSLAVSNEIKGLSATPGVFALSEPADSNRPRRTAPPVELRFFSLSQPNTFPKTLFFPKTISRRCGPRRASPRPRRGRGKRTSRAATCGSQRLARGAGGPGSRRKRSAHREEAKSDARLRSSAVRPLRPASAHEVVLESGRRAGEAASPIIGRSH